MSSPSKPWSTKRIFSELFAPLYPPETLARLDDLRSASVEPCTDAAILARIDEIADAFRHLAPPLLSQTEGVLDGSDASVHVLGAALTRERRDLLVDKPTPGVPGMPLLASLVIHGALYVGRCVVNNHAGRWILRQPLWESTVRLDTKIGTCDVAPFSWWLKSLSDEEIDRQQLGPRYRQHVEIPCFDADALPVIVGATERIPRLSFPAYVQLFQHLEAHAPGIRGPGDDFPTAERFGEFKLAWVDFEWLGGGRLLLMHGPGQHGGAHLFWMNSLGFLKSAYYPADRAPNHRVQVEGNVLRVVVSIDGTTRRHEMPWWGM